MTKGTYFYFAAICIIVTSAQLFTPPTVNISPPELTFSRPSINIPRPSIDLPRPSINLPYPYGGKCCSDNTINVFGSSTIQANPDIAYLSATITANGQTVSDAVQKLSTQSNIIIQILQSNGLTSSNYQVQSLNVYPNISYPNGVPVVNGQIATETFQITIPTINPDGSNIGKLIDNLASIKTIIIGGLSFDIRNKTSVYAQTRQLAFQNAQQKAVDYTTSLLIGLGSLISVVDTFSSPAFVDKIPMSNAKPGNLIPTTVNVGTIPISYNVESTYAITS